MDRSLSFNCLANSSIVLWLLLVPRHPSIPRRFPAGKSVASLRILSSIFWNNAKRSWMWMHLHFSSQSSECSWGSAFPVLAPSPPASLQTPPWLLPLSCPCGCQWLCPVLEAGDSSSLILFTPNPAIWKWQWLFISFPKLPRVSLSHPHLLVSFLSIVFHSFVSCIHLQGVTDTLSCVCEVAISPSQDLQCLLVDSCPCWECWLAGHLGCAGLVCSAPILLCA